LKKLKVADLKKLLLAARLEITGKKAALVERLLAYQSEPLPAQASPPDGCDEVLVAYNKEEAALNNRDDDDDDDDAGEGTGEVAAEPSPDADVENAHGLGTLLRDGITRSVFSKSWWNAFGKRKEQEEGGEKATTAFQTNLDTCLNPRTCLFVWIYT
jgi:hypothetical protein